MLRAHATVRMPPFKKLAALTLCVFDYRCHDEDARPGMVALLGRPHGMFVDELLSLGLTEQHRGAGIVALQHCFDKSDDGGLTHASLKSLLTPASFYHKVGFARVPRESPTLRRFYGNATAFRARNCKEVDEEHTPDNSLEKWNSRNQEKKLERVSPAHRRSRWWSRRHLAAASEPR